MKKVVEHMVAVQDTDGYIGIYAADSRFSNEEGNGELWTQSRGTWVMLTWYEITEDAKVLDAVKRSVQRTMKAFGSEKGNPFDSKIYGGVSHGLMYAENVAWLYDITKDTVYRDWSIWLYQAYCERNRFDNDIHYSFLKDPNQNFIGHSAHSFEHLRVLLNSWYMSGAPVFDTLYKNYRTKLEKVLLPSGAGFGYENMWAQVSHPDSTPVEYCAITELELSSLAAVRLTGDPSWGDLAEKIFFNAAQGARLPDDKAVTYCKSDNCYHLHGINPGFKNKEKGIAYGDSDVRYKYSPTHVDCAECCSPQSTRCYPAYVASMWMRSDSGLAAMFFGPCKVNTTVGGVKVEIEETTGFPFDDKVTIIINPEKEVNFKLTIRIPEWGTDNTVEAGNAVVQKRSGYCDLSKSWKKGDKVTITFKPAIVAKKSNNGETYLQRGAIVYALNVPSIDSIVRTYPVKGFADQYFFAKDNFNYKKGLDASAGQTFGFSLVSGKAGANIWVNSPLKLKGELVDLATGKKETAELVPMGSTILRRVTFPTK